MVSRLRCRRTRWYKHGHGVGACGVFLARGTHPNSISCIDPEIIHRVWYEVHDLISVDISRSQLSRHPLQLISVLVLYDVGQ